MGRALAISAEEGMDAALFSANAERADLPAGILQGVTPIASTGATGVEGAADDLSLLAAALGANGIALAAGYAATWK